MPQLDIVSYFPQFFWFCVFFTGFYVVLIQNYLPKLTRIIAVREALQPNPDQISSNTQESDTVTTKTHEVFAKTVHQTKEKCVQQFTETQNLLNIQTDVFNKHTNQAFTKYQTKKIQLNQTVKQTLQQMQTLLPGLKLRSSPMSQKQTSQFFSQALVNKLVNKTKSSKGKIK